MEEQKYTLQELNKEEADALTKDLQEVLKKHSAEMGVKASIELLKRVPIEIPSPFMPKDHGDNDKTQENPKID